MPAADTRRNLGGPYLIEAGLDASEKALKKKKP
jgi:hypothetical protein